MNKKILITIIIILFLGLAYAVVSAFMEPVGSPPSGNVPAPINIGPEAQSKTGDLEAENFVVRNSLTLGDVRRTEWPEGLGGCNWEGTKCNCTSERASIGGIKLTVGTTCEAGQLTNFKIMELDISSRSKRCGNSPPAGCSAGLYSKVDR